MQTRILFQKQARSRPGKPRTVVLLIDEYPALFLCPSLSPPTSKQHHQTVCRKVRLSHPLAKPNPCRQPLHRVPAFTTALQGPRCALQTRILFHCAQKQANDDKLMQYHGQLSDSIEDQLSLASIHYVRSHFQEATDIYKRLLLEHRDYLALNVYVALCYCKVRTALAAGI